MAQKAPGLRLRRKTATSNSSTKPCLIEFMTPINFPKLTRTKTEAQRLAAEIFPGERVALSQLKPDTTHPRYQLTHDTADTLRTLLFWLHEQNPPALVLIRIAVRNWLPNWAQHSCAGTPALKTRFRIPPPISRTGLSSCKTTKSSLSKPPPRHRRPLITLSAPSSTRHRPTTPALFQTNEKHTRHRYPKATRCSAQAH